TDGFFNMIYSLAFVRRLRAGHRQGVRAATDSRPASRCAVVAKQRNKGRQSGSCRSPYGNNGRSAGCYTGRRETTRIGGEELSAREAQQQTERQGEDAESEIRGLVGRSHAGTVT